MPRHTPRSTYTIDAVLKLLSEVQFEARTDHLIFAGDFISKGPSSPAVIDLAMSAKASCVRGNHEDRVMLAYRDMYSHRLTEEQKEIRKSKTPTPPAPGMPENMRQNDDEVPNLVDESFEHGSAVDRELAGNLTTGQVDWMAKCPVILDIGRIDGLGDVHVVHAGLIPGVRLEKQDPMGVMHMRTIDLETHVPSSSAQGMPWFKVYCLSPSYPSSPPLNTTNKHTNPTSSPTSFGTNTKPSSPATSAPPSSTATTPAKASNYIRIVRGLIRDVLRVGN